MVRVGSFVGRVERLVDVACWSWLAVQVIWLPSIAHFFRISANLMLWLLELVGEQCQTIADVDGIAK